MSKLPNHDNYTQFYGAIIWSRGGTISSLACNGNRYVRFAGAKDTATYKLAIGTLFVFPGCTFYAFTDSNYEGTMKTFKGPASIYKVPTSGLFNCGGVACAKSFIVECEMSMPDCVPSDKWSSVANLDNTESSIPTKFTYEYQIGTEWSAELLQGFYGHISVTETLKQSFFKLFEVEDSVEFSTGYNWQETSTSAKGELQSFKVETEIPAGKILKIEQAVGLCGDSAVKTEMFKFTEIKNGTTFDSYISIKNQDNFN